MKETPYRIGMFFVRLSGNTDFRCKVRYRDTPDGMRCQLPQGHVGLHRAHHSGVTAAWIGDEAAHVPTSPKPRKVAL